MNSWMSLSISDCLRVSDFTVFSQKSINCNYIQYFLFSNNFEIEYFIFIAELRRNPALGVVRSG